MGHRRIGNKMSKMSAGLIVLFAKVGIKFLGVIVKLAKFGKVGLAVGTAATYAYLLTWQFALVIMISLFFHESGHIWAMKRCGLKTKGIYFIPFLGAAAVADDMFKSRRDEVYIAIMGPIWGMALAVATFIVYVYNGNAFFGAAAGWMAMVNLFNLLPINPLDGGRVMKSVAFSVGPGPGILFLAIGTIISIILTFYFGILLFSFLLLIGLLEAWYEIEYRTPKGIIRLCKKDVDIMIKEKDEFPIRQRIAAVKLKEVLANNDTDVNKMNIIKEYGNENNIKENPELFILSKVLSARIDKFSPINRMEIKGIVFSILIYISVAYLLWGFMTYMSHIPEVEIARQLFMS